MRRTCCIARACCCARCWRCTCWCRWRRFALVKLLTLAPGVEIGLLVLAASAGAPLLPRKLLRIGDGAYIFSLVLLSSLLAIVVVPAWLSLLGPQFGTPLELAPDARGAGCWPSPSCCRWRRACCCAAWLPDFAECWSSRLIGAAGGVLTACALALLVLHWEVLLVASWGGVLALMALVAMALAIGHALGGPARRRPHARWPWPARRATSASPCWWPRRCPGRARR